MNKLIFLIFLLLTPLLSWGAGDTSPRPKTPSKAPPKLFKQATVKLSASHLQDHSRGKVVVLLEPMAKVKVGNKIHEKCLSLKIECQLFADFKSPEILNLTVYGPKKNTQNLLVWIKAHTLQYLEKTHQQKINKI